MNNTGICQFCNKSCGKHLKRHIRDVHEKIKSVKCQYCDFTCTHATSLRMHKCYLERERQKTRDEAIAKGANPDEKINERFYQIKLEKETGGKSLACKAGIADIVSDDLLIEIKNWKYWKQAIGQIMVYSVYFPGRVKRLHLFGVKPDQKTIDTITEVCNSLNILMTYE